MQLLYKSYRYRLDYLIRKCRVLSCCSDALTLIPNATGSRLPDKLTHQHFGKYHAGCYPANLNLPFAERTVNFGLALTLKETEDKLDSLICAYVAAHWCYWGEQRNQVLDNYTTGYIVIPQRIKN